MEISVWGDIYITDYLFIALKSNEQSRRFFLYKKKINLKILNLYVSNLTNHNFLPLPLSPSYQYTFECVGDKGRKRKLWYVRGNLDDFIYLFIF